MSDKIISLSIPLIDQNVSADANVSHIDSSSPPQYSEFETYQNIDNHQSTHKIMKILHNIITVLRRTRLHLIVCVKKFRKNRNFKLITLITLIFSLLIFMYSVNYKSINFSKTYYYTYLPLWKETNEVQFKKDLVNLDLINYLNYRSTDKMPITPEIQNQKYKRFKIKGFVTNLNLNSITSKKKKKTSKDLIDENGKLIPVNEYELSQNNDYSSNVDCEDLEHSSEIQYSKERKILEDDLISVRKETLLKDDEWAKKVGEEEEKDMTNEEIIKKSWTRFGGSSIWLEEHHCYITVTRIMYAGNGDRLRPDVSIIRAQAFDKDWNELIGKRIPKLDISLPDNIEEEIQKIDKEFGVSATCEYLVDTPSSYESCLARQANDFLDETRRRDSLLENYFVTYPTIYRFPFNSGGQFTGAEDPRIILRKTGQTQEPVVVFNMQDSWGRQMYAFLPHRTTDRLVQFVLPGSNRVEKNWSPFFSKEDVISDLSRGTIHFVYGYSPLEILKCSLNDGLCERVFEKRTLGLSEANNYNGIRGGTQLVPLPSVIARISGKQMWLSFAKLHLDNCGCGRRFYRPMLNLLIEHNGIYHQELVVPSMDFDTDVLGWKHEGYTCEDVNVMSPNSIAFWDVIGQDPKTKKFEDYIIFTYSEADAISKVMTIRGILDYIVKMYSDKDIAEDFIPSDDSDHILSKTLKCMSKYADLKCKQYGASHKS
ncbi:hypothetical protein TBLA_0G03660 [Henningerozyma blattae CBS 6284]|uniref:Uncharacterized protein n=1 Tax=Henningerozyma blattae (strain ATCC 34711 / CBS 6284 / DSM 70876 / NBRC 10599 / NRRL Y-10934 / UCD 77-7) TaxID=1071380 RepID=I2H7E8_HENB6|nr:hypothetical protein TBLA_0G03660 [Tetrapisispora blattae CBS 6284]CCH62300.1 hypothetical protein TBLA_0G03660 [Tetrapisispora blattae CBS 6284]